MKTRHLFALIVAFVISISNVSASGLLGEVDLLEGSGRGYGKVISFKSTREGQLQAKELEQKNTPLSAREVRSTERKPSDKHTPSRGAFEFLQPNTACLLLMILFCSIAGLVR